MCGILFDIIFFIYVLFKIFAIINIKNESFVVFVGLVIMIKVKVLNTFKL